MRRLLLFLCVGIILSPFRMLAQTNEWSTQYVTFDDAINGTENRTSSVAVVAPNNFVALVARGSSAGGDLINYLELVFPKKKNEMTIFFENRAHSIVKRIKTRIMRENRNTTKFDRFNTMCSVVIVSKFVTLIKKNQPCL